MGRRAVRNVHEGLDLTGKLLEYEDLPNPWGNAASLFGVDRPLEIEVGSGKGLFLRRATAANPEHNFLGIEIAFKYARFAAANLLRDGLTNGVVASCDALKVFRELVPDASLEAVHVYFPDPWWKKRHKKRRVFNEALVASIARALVPGGELHVATDVEEYFGVIRELIAADPRFAEIPPPPLGDAEDDHDYLTNFERKYRIEGRAVYRASYRYQPA